MQEYQNKELRINFIEQVSEKVNSNASPWLLSKTKNIPNPILRLHNEIIDFAQFVSPSHDEHSINLQNYQKIQKLINGKFPSSHFYAPFLLNKIYLSRTQTELYVCFEEVNEQIIHSLASILLEGGLTNLQVNLNKDKKGEDSIISGELNNCVIQILVKQIGWSQFLKDAEDYMKALPELRYLYLILICMIRQRNFHVNIKPMAAYGLVDIFLFERRKQKKRTLGENLLKFLQYYGMGTLQQRRIVFIPKSRNRYDISVDAQNFSFVVGKTELCCSNFRDLFSVLKNRYRLISNFSFPVGKSILSYLVNPSQQEFRYI